MTNATMRANAQAMPDRRLFLAAGSAAAVFTALRASAANAVADDADVYAAIERVNALRAAEKAAGDRLSTLERLLPRREDVAALRVREGDATLLEASTPIGGTLSQKEVETVRGRKYLLWASLNAPTKDAVFGPIIARMAEVVDAEQMWSDYREEEEKRLGIDATQETFDDAVSATADAAGNLLDLKPQTVAGLRAILTTLKNVGFFNFQQDAEDIGRFLLEAPALGTEA